MVDSEGDNPNDNAMLDHAAPSVHDELEESAVPRTPNTSASTSTNFDNLDTTAAGAISQSTSTGNTHSPATAALSPKHEPTPESGESPDQAQEPRLEPEAEADLETTQAEADPEQQPDPFQLDDPDDPVSDDDDDESLAEGESSKTPFGASSQLTIVPPITEVSLHHASLPQVPPLEKGHEPKSFTPVSAAPGAQVGKPQPPLPESSDEDDEDEDGPPALYLPGLVVPGLFLPIPNTDPLSTLQTKYIPEPRRRIARDISGEWKTKDFQNLVMSNHWRALAQMARDRIVNSPAADLDNILNLWYLRLSCLARLRLFNQTSAECSNLFAVLNNVEPPHARAHLFDAVLPFELEMMHARLKYWAGDHLGYLDALSPLLRKCKVRARAAGAMASGTGTAAMWRERGTRVSLSIASQLVEMRDFGAAARVLEPLCRQEEGSPALRSAIARIYLQGGNLGAASQHFAAVEADPAADNITKDMNRAIEAAAHGHWDQAIPPLKKVMQEEPDNAVAVNNLAVAYLGLGKVEEGITVMEIALKANPIAITATEPWLFNLSTLYELRSTTTWDKKRELLIDVAKWSGDGLKTSCLKLPPV